MKKPVILLIFLSMSFLLRSQQLQITATSGGSLINSSNAISYTIGEPVVFTAHNSISLLQGFQQPHFNFAGITKILSASGIKVFPNPAVDFITVELNETDKKFCILIYNSQGKQVGVSEILTCKTNIYNLRQLSSGIFYLVVEDLETSAKETFKILKLTLK